MNVMGSNMNELETNECKGTTIFELETNECKGIETWMNWKQINVRGPQWMN